MMGLKPLVVVCGTTGVGKSKLAIELALSLTKSRSVTAKIINADAMQVYEGLDVITNKVTSAEKQGIEHLLMSSKCPGEQYVVGEWVRDSVSLIDRMHAQGQIPIVVGGTAYWIHHLLFCNTLPSTAGLSKNKQARILAPALAQGLAELPSELRKVYYALPTSPPSAKTDPDGAFNLHELLARLDPTMAARWHWRDTRKVLRNLEIIVENGCTATEAITKAARTQNILRYNSLIFWLYARPDVLNPRLDERVEDMVSRGLMDEILSLHQLALDQARRGHSQDSSIETVRSPRCPAPDAGEDYSLGIYQSIGYREFRQYLSAPERSEELYNSALDEMKRNTRKYAQRQVKWIKNKLLPAVAAANSHEETALYAHAYLLDATDVGPAWGHDIMSKAQEVLDAFLRQSDLPEPTSLSELACEMLAVRDKPTSPQGTLTARRKLICPVCTTDRTRPVMIEEGDEWEAHQRTRVHRRLARNKDKANSGDMHGSGAADGEAVAEHAGSDGVGVWQSAAIGERPSQSATNS